VTGRLFVAAVVSGLCASLLATPPALAQEANQVTGVAVEQADGFATLSWDAVAGATDYQIERTPVGADNLPTGPAVIVGVWRPNRTVTPDSPTFADAGFNPGERFQWRVRARTGATEHPFSAPVSDTTLPPWGSPFVPGENLRTQWEVTQAAQYTSDANEYEYTAALDAASDRVRVVEIGRTVLGRPINMFIIGYSRPPRSVRAVARSTAALINCNVHGNEPSSREACLIMARELAFADDPRTLEILDDTTVLIVPTINGDGRALNTRGNVTGQDLNRDYSLIRQPETFSFVQMMSDYDPEAAFDGHEFGNSQAGDLPVLPPRHLNVARSIFDQSKSMIEDWLYEQGSDDGWWYCPYGCQNGGAVGLSQETILRNTMGLKSVVGSLLEARSVGGPTRPNETNTPNNRRRKTYSALYTYQEFLDYQLANEDAIERAIRRSIRFQRSNTGRIVFRGSYPIPAFPAPHPGESPPPNEDPTPEQILDPPPCAYVLSELQYSGPQPDGRPVGERLAAHGLEVDRRRRQRDYVVPMRQPQRGLIPLLLDGQAAEPMVAATRVPCRDRDDDDDD
jgi:Zinc carboxypeptidase